VFQDKRPLDLNPEVAKELTAEKNNTKEPDFKTQENMDKIMLSVRKQGGSV
jgi:hypothetical protein